MNNSPSYLEPINSVLKNKKSVLKNLYKKYPTQEVDEALSKVISNIFKTKEIVLSDSFWRTSVSRLLINYSRDNKRWVNESDIDKTMENIVFHQKTESYEEIIIKTPDYKPLLRAIDLLPKSQRAAVDFFMKNGFLNKEGNYDTNKANFRHGVARLKKELESKA